MCNARVYMEVRRQHRLTTTTLRMPKAVLSKNRRERRMFFQFTVTIMFFIAFNVTFNALPMVTNA